MDTYYYSGLNVSNLTGQVMSEINEMKRGE